MELLHAPRPPRSFDNPMENQAGSIRESSPHLISRLHPLVGDNNYDWPNSEWWIFSKKTHPMVKVHGTVPKRWANRADVNQFMVTVPSTFTLV